MRPVQVGFVERRYLRRWTDTLSSVLFAATPLLLPVAPFFFGALGFYAGVAGLVAAVFLRLWRRPPRRTGPAPISIDRKFLSLPAEFVALPRVRAAFIVPAGASPGEDACLVVDLVDGSNVVLGVEGRSARLLLDNLRLRPEQRTVWVPLVGAFSFTRSWILFLHAVFGTALVLESSRDSLALLIAACAVVVLLAAPLLWVLLPRLLRHGSAQLLAGSDGLRIRGVDRGGQEHFVPYAAIASLETTAGKLVVRRRETRPLSLALPAGSDEHVRALRQRFDRATASTQGAERIAPMLARGDRSIADWRASLATFADRGTDFRQPGYGSEDLAGVLESGGASPEICVGAAIALRACDPEGPERIRVAASETVNDELRAALVAIADDEPADAAMERALRARP